METVFDSPATGSVPDPLFVTPEPTPSRTADGALGFRIHHPTSAWADSRGSSPRCFDGLHREVSLTVPGDNESDGSTDDPATRLLGRDFAALLTSTVKAAGRANHPGVLVAFDGLDLRPLTHGVRGAVLRAVPWLRPPAYPRSALADVSGSFRPRTLSLVLGPPGSGKSALLSALAGRLEGTAGRWVGLSHTLRGTVRYADRHVYPRQRPRKGEVRVEKLVSFVPQRVDFLPALTARQTVRFARALFHAPTEAQLREEGLGAEECQQLRDMQASYPQLILQRIGLEPVADLPVSALTDGQRRLLSCVEGYVPEVLVLLTDDVLTGVNSDTAHRMCVGMRKSAQEKHRAIIMAQSTITPELFDVFDDLTLLAAGRVVYQGPRAQVLGYFQRLGFHCPAGMHAADFVQHLLHPAGMAKYDVTPGQDPDVYAQLWRASELCAERAEEDVEGGRQSAYELAQLPAVGFHHRKFAHRYAGGWWRTTVLCINRQWYLAYSNKPALVLRFLILLFISFVLGSLFFDLRTTDYTPRMGVIFYAMMVNSMAFGNIPAIVASRRTLYRELAANFYHPVSHAFAWTVADIPIGAVETFVFCIIVYWMCAFSPSGANFFVFWSALFLVKLGMGAFFRLLGLLSPTDVLGTGLAAIQILLFLLHTGYAIAYVDVKPWWRGIYWTNPLQYGFTVLTITEFHSSRYSGLKDPSDPTSPTWGDYYLSQRKLSTDPTRVWTSFLFLLGFPVFVFAMTCLALAFARFPDPVPTTAPAAPLPTDVELQPDGSDDVEQSAGAKEVVPLPVAAVTLAWQGVTYSPPARGQKWKVGPELLSNVNGFARPGELTLIIGENGSGKTLLLEVLGGRRTLGIVEGTVLLNGQPAEVAERRRCIALTSRATCHSLQSTVAEALQWNATLCLPREVPAYAKQAHIRRLMDLLGLAGLAGCQIGKLTERSLTLVTLAIELAANPSVVLLDELTTGLDWAAMQRVLPALQALRQDGRTLVLAAHQPTQDLLALVDMLAVLRRGRLVCAGDAAHGCAELIDFFHTIPAVPRFVPGQNPAHWALGLVCDEQLFVAAEYKRSELCARNAYRLGAATATPITAADIAPVEQPRQYQASLPLQFALLVRKLGLVHWRCHAYNWSRALSVAVLGLVLGSSFWQVSIHDQQSAFSIVSIQYLSLVFVAFTFMNTVQGVVARGRSVFYGDKAKHMYSGWALNGAMALWEAVYVTVLCLLCAVIFYPMVGLNPEIGAIVFWFWNFTLYNLFATYFGLFCGLLIAQPELVLALMGILTTLFSLMTGYLLPRLAIPWWWRWLHYGVPLPYTFQIATSVQLYCAAADADAHNPGDCATFPLVSGGKTIQYPVWAAVRDRFYLSYGDRWMYLGIVFAFLAIVHLLTGVVLARVDHGKR